MEESIEDGRETRIGHPIQGAHGSVFTDRYVSLIYQTILTPSFNPSFFQVQFHDARLPFFSLHSVGKKYSLFPSKRLMVLVKRAEQFLQSSSDRELLRGY